MKNHNLLRVLIRSILKEEAETDVLGEPDLSSEEDREEEQEEWGRGRRHPPEGGEGREKERGGEGQRCRRYRKVFGYSQDQALIQKYDGVSSKPCTTFGGRRI